MAKRTLDLDDLISGDPDYDAELLYEGGSQVPRKADMDWADDRARRTIDAADHAARAMGVRGYDDFHTPDQDEYFGPPASGLPDSVKVRAYEQEMRPARNASRQEWDAAREQVAENTEHLGELWDDYVAYSPYAREDPRALEAAAAHVWDSYKHDGTQNVMRRIKKDPERFFEDVDRTLLMGPSRRPDEGASRTAVFGGDGGGRGQGAEEDLAGLFGGGSSRGSRSMREREADEPADMMAELQAWQKKSGYF